MEANDILHSDLLDILFEHRNKQYGAYALRRGYNKGLLISMLIVAAITALLFGLYFLTSHSNSQNTIAAAVVDVQLQEIKDEKKPDPVPPPPPPPKFIAPQVQ